MVTAYAMFAFGFAKVGLKIVNSRGEEPNDLDLHRYYNLVALDMDVIMAHPQFGFEGMSMSSK